MKKLFTRAAAIIMGISMAAGVGVAIAAHGKEAATVDAAAGDNYNLVKDVSDLAAGDEVLLGYTNGSVHKASGALNANTSSYLKAEDATISNEVLTYTGTNVKPLILAKSGNNWTFTYDSTTVATTAAKKMCISTTSSSVSTWTISITTAGVATITSTTSSYGTIYYNTGSPRFLNYTSSQAAIGIYKKATASGYSITPTITNGSATGSTTIAENGNATVTITPNEGYKLPSAVSVTGATSDYNATTGVVSLSNPTGAVTITATCPALASYTISKNITNGSATGAASIFENGEAEVTITPNTGYKLPSSITVSGATSDYNATTGVVSLSNPTANVTISATMEVAAQYTVSLTLTHLTANPSSYTMYENEEVNITLTVDDSTNYSLPTTIQVVNSANYGYNSSSGVITLHGAQGNVTITASAIAKPAEASEGFDFTNANLWTGSELNTDNKFTVYSRTVDLITMTWDTNGKTSLAGAYWNPARVYVGHKVTVSATTGQGAVTTIKSITFHTVKNGSSSTTSGTNGATITVTQPTSGAGTIASSVSGDDVTYTISGTVTEFNLVISGSQTRWSTVEVVYEKDQSDVALQSISAICAGVLVSQQVTPIITFNPAGASNKNVSYEIVEGTTALAEVSETGVVTGLGAGTARLKITPEDTHAAAITIDVEVTALPNVYGVEVGKKYAATSNGYELTGINASNYGESTSYTESPSNAFPIRVVNGLYSRTVALEVTINENTKYLSWDADANANSLNYVDAIERASSWIFAEVNSTLQIRNVGAYSRMLTFYGGTTLRFSCYPEATATGDNCTALSFVEIAEEKTDKEHVQDFVDLYMHMLDYTENKGWCNDGQHAYYLTAKAGYNSIIYNVSARENLWTTDSDFAEAKQRYETWAVMNNDADPYDGNDTVVDKINVNESNYLLDSNSAQNSVIVTIIIASIALVATTGAVTAIIIKKRATH